MHGWHGVCKSVSVSVSVHESSLHISIKTVQSLHYQSPGRQWRVAPPSGPVIFKLLTQIGDLHFSRKKDTFYLFFKNCFPKHPSLVIIINSILVVLIALSGYFLSYFIIIFFVMKNPVNFRLGDLILKLLVRIGKWHQKLSEKTVMYVPRHSLWYHTPHTTISVGLI